MATCLDLTYSRTVSTTLLVEAKNWDKENQEIWGVKDNLRGLKSEQGW
jgi:hypothetical protein